MRDVMLAICALLVGWFVGRWDERHPYTRERRWDTLRCWMGFHTGYLLPRCYVCDKPLLSHVPCGDTRPAAGADRPEGA